MINFEYGSVCSGIEAASVAWEPLGFKPLWFSQFDPENDYTKGLDFPSAVLAHYWPHIENLGDMTTIAERVTGGEISAPDVLVGGTPCQAFSIAGLRNGLSDERGQLTISYVGLLDAIDQQRRSNGQPESVAVWENVPGVLYSKDNAFGCFLGTLSGEECELVAPGGKWSNAGYVHGPKRSIAWRVLDAQYFGVAQRRRRVFLVASARPYFDPKEVLFEFGGVRRDIAPRRDSWEETAAPISKGAFGRDDAGVNFELNGVNHAYEIGKTYGIPGNWIGRKPENGGNAVEPMHDIAPCQTRSDRHAVAYKDECSREYKVRRLTPVECERLQGFPDNYTRIPFRGKGANDCPDNQRYQALGNSIAVPCMKWIGERIAIELMRSETKLNSTKGVKSE